MDRILPSEGSGAGSIPARDICNDEPEFRLESERAGIEKFEYIARNEVSTIRKLYRSCNERCPARDTQKFKDIVRGEGGDAAVRRCPVVNEAL